MQVILFRPLSPRFLHLTAQRILTTFRNANRFLPVGRDYRGPEVSARHEAQDRPAVGEAGEVLGYRASFVEPLHLGVELVQRTGQVDRRERRAAGEPRILPVQVIFGFVVREPELQGGLGEGLDDVVTELLIGFGQVQNDVPVRKHWQQGRELHELLFRRGLAKLHGDEVVVRIGRDREVIAGMVSEPYSHAEIL